MRPQQTQRWKVGDFFIVTLLDHSYSVGQVLDVSIPHTASCVFFERQLKAAPLSDGGRFDPGEPIAIATVVEAHLDRGAWQVFSHGSVSLPKERWPNESTREKRWVGSVVYTGAMLEAFVNAYFALSPWDQYHDPQEFDKLLIAPSKKPKRLLYKNAGRP